MRKWIFEVVNELWTAVFWFSRLTVDPSQDPIIKRTWRNSEINNSFLYSWPTSVEGYFSTLLCIFHWFLSHQYRLVAVSLSSFLESHTVSMYHGPCFFLCCYTFRTDKEPNSRESAENRWSDFVYTPFQFIISRNTQLSIIKILLLRCREGGIPFVED